MTKESIQHHGWELLPDPPYSPDLALTDFHIFRCYAALFDIDVTLKTWLDKVEVG